MEFSSVIEITLNDTHSLSICHFCIFFPRFKHNFSFTFTTEICFWWLQTSENNYSVGLFLSRFNRKMSFYQPLHTKTNSSPKVICSLRFIKIHISLRKKQKTIYWLPPPREKKIMAYHGLSFCYLIYCSNISPQKYVFAIHFVLLSLMSLIEVKEPSMISLFAYELQRSCTCLANLTII